MDNTGEPNPRPTDVDELIQAMITVGEAIAPVVTDLVSSIATAVGPSMQMAIIDVAKRAAGVTHIGIDDRDPTPLIQAAINRARAEGYDVSELSDGHHAFVELYEWRRSLHAAAVRTWLREGIPVVKSRRHSDGEPCFGGGWFIVVAELPTGQISSHYKEMFWNEFACPEADTAPEWDGHCSLRAHLRLFDHNFRAAGEKK